MVKKLRVKPGDTIYIKNNNSHQLVSCKLWITTDRKSQFEISGFYCLKCKYPFVDELDFKYLVTKKLNCVFSDKSLSCSSQGSEEIIDKKIIKNIPLQGIFLTRSSLSYCHSHNHNLTDINGQLAILRVGGKVFIKNVPATWCSNCARFYILEYDYLRCAKEGTILCKIVEETYWQQRSYEREEGYNLKDESLLHSMGYNVNSQLGLTKIERERILRYAIKYGVLTKGEICSHLDYLIRRSKKMKNMKNAIIKWQHDRKFVELLDLEVPKSTIEILNIRGKKLK